jgi:hypothetical protein
MLNPQFARTCFLRPTVSIAYIISMSITEYLGLALATNIKAARPKLVKDDKKDDDW